jgi:hypothetical protein
MLTLVKATKYIEMLESLVNDVDGNDKIFVESAIAGFKTMLEGSIYVEFSPILGKILPSRYIPSDADVEEHVTKSGKKEFRPKQVNISSDDLVRDTIMWIYNNIASLNKDVIDDDFIKMILFNPKPEVTATGFENQPIKPVTGDLSTHPLWDSIKNEISNILTTSTDPYFTKLRSRLETKMIDDEKSYNRLKKTNNLGMDKIEKVNQLTDTYKSARKTGYVDVIADKNEAERKQQSENALKNSQLNAEKRMAIENEKKNKLSNMSLADIAAKYGDKPTSSVPSMDDMKSKLDREEEEKAARRKKWDELFASR